MCDHDDQCDDCGEKYYEDYGIIKECLKCTREICSTCAGKIISNSTDPMLKHNKHHQSYICKCCSLESDNDLTQSELWDKLEKLIKEASYKSAGISPEINGLLDQSLIIIDKLNK